MDWYAKLKQRKAIKKRSINACDLASRKMVGLVLVRRWEKGIDPIFTDNVGKCYKSEGRWWKIVKVDRSSENYVWKLDIIQKSLRSLSIFLMWLF